LATLNPIGGVVAYDNAVSVSGVGFDIGCGNMAVRTSADFSDIRQDVPKIMTAISKSVSFGVGRYRDEDLPDLYSPYFERPEWNLDLIRVLWSTLTEILRTKAHLQTGILP
jgi:tRNA-splicing ligase RtcB